MQGKYCLLVVFLLAMTACNDEQNKRSSIRVIDEQGQGVANAAVVIGNQDGQVLTSLATNDVGEAYYPSMPANATITAAISCYSASRDWTSHLVNTTYNVNIPDLTVSLGACSENDTRQVAVTVSSAITGVSSSDITLGPITYSGPNAALHVTGGLQDDDTVSVFASGYDDADNLRGYGFALDRPAADGGTIEVVIDRTDFVQHTNTLINIPASPLSYYVFASLIRKHGQTNLPYNFTSGMAPVPATVITYSAESFSDNNMLGAAVSLDQNNDGTPDGNVGLMRSLRSASGQVFDFSSTPRLPNSLAYEQGGNSRPVISWANNDPRAIVNTLSFTYRPPAPARSIAYYTMTAPGLATTLVFPELPDNLAALRPAAHTSLSLSAMVVDGQTNYSDYLTAFATHNGYFYAAEGFKSYGFATISRSP